MDEKQLKMYADALGMSVEDVRALISQQSGGATGPLSGQDAITAQSPYFGSKVHMPVNQVDLVSQFNKFAIRESELSHSIEADISGKHFKEYSFELKKVRTKMSDLKAQMSGKKKGYASSNYEEAILAPLDWDAATLKKFVNTGIMRNISGFEPGMGMPEVMAKWDDMVQASIMMSQKGKRFSPWDVMATYGQKGKFGTIEKDGWVFDVGTGERLAYKGPKTKTTVSKDVDLSNPNQVQALSRQILAQLLGRAPSESELAQYKNSINQYEQENPLITETTTTLTPNFETGEVEATGSTSTRSGGVTEAGRAELVGEEVRKTKEYAKYQSATYFDSLIDIIGGPFG